MTVFGSNNIESMNSGKLIKFLEFKRGAMSENEVRRDGYNNRIFSNWERERKAELLSLQSQLRLKPIYKNPPPIWMHPTLGAMFGDSFLEGTGLEGGPLSASSSVFEVIFDHLVKALVSCASPSQSHESDEISIPSQQPLVAAPTTATATHDHASNDNDPLTMILSQFQFTHHDRQTMNYIYQAIINLKILSKKYDLAKKNGSSQLVYYFKLLKKYIMNLQVGETLLIPGGIGESVVIYILEYEYEQSYRFTVVNTSPEVGLNWHLCNPCLRPSHLYYQTILTVKEIQQQKIFDDIFWGILLKLAIIPSPQDNTSEKLYDLLLPYLVDKPIDQIVYESQRDIDDDDHMSSSTTSSSSPSSSSSSSSSSEYRSPQHSNTSYVRTILETINYILKRHSLHKLKIQQLCFVIETQFIDFISHDMQFIHIIGTSERKVIELCCHEYSRKSSQLGKSDLLTVTQLNSILKFIHEIKFRLEHIPTSEQEQTTDQPLIHLDDDQINTTTTSGTSTGKTQKQILCEQNSLTLFPLFDRLRRVDDVNGLAGPPIILPQYIPIDFLQIPLKVLCLDDVITAIRYCDRLCTLISVQQHCIKNRNFLKLSLIEYTIIKILPCPQPGHRSCCVWQTPMSYSCQLDLCICLGRILEHFISSAYSLQNNKPLDAIKLIVTSMIAAMVDVTLRHISIDQTSEFCLHYMGKRAVATHGGVKELDSLVYHNLSENGYSISMASFDTQSETIELHTPELCVARAAILDYFDEQKSMKKIFNWENGHQLDEPTAEFVTNLATSLAFPSDPKSLIGYITTRNQLINKNYPEFHILR
jgi:hypothetical protein